MHTHPKICLTLDHKLTYIVSYNKHIDNKTAGKESKTVPILRDLSLTKWGKHKPDTLLSTYKVVTRQILKYSSTIWSSIASTTNITNYILYKALQLRLFSRLDFLDTLL